MGYTAHIKDGYLNTTSTTSMFVDGYMALQTQSSAPASVSGFGILYTNSNDNQLYYVSPTSGNISIGASSVDGAALSVKGAPYFAKGDGVTDDSAAINQALTDAYGLGKYVFVPPGTYFIGTVLTVPSFTAMVGIPELSVIYGTGSSFSMMTFADTTQQVLIKDLTFFSTGVAGTAANNAIIGGGFDTIVIDNCRFNSVRNGVRFSNNAPPCERSIIRNCEFINMVGTTGAISGRYFKSSIINNRFTNCTAGTCISIASPTTDTIISGNVFDNVLVGMSISGGSTSYGITITNNVITNTTGTGGSGFAIAVFNCSNVTVSNNVIDTIPGGASAISMAGGMQNFTIANNTILFSTNTGCNGITITNSQGIEGSIIGNNISRRDGYATGPGIGLNFGDRITISDNSIANLVPGIFLNNLSTSTPISELTISNNSISIDPTLTNLTPGFSGNNFSGISIMGGATKILAHSNIVSGYNYGFYVDKVGQLGNGNGIVIRNNAVHGAVQIGQDTSAASASNILVEDNFLDTGNNLWTTNGTNVLVRNNRFYSTTFSANTTVTSNAMDVSQVNILEPASGTINNFTNGWLGQIIQIKATGSVTISNGTNIKLANSVDFVMASGDTLQLVQLDSGIWNEVGRKTNTSSKPVYSGVTLVSAQYTVVANDSTISANATTAGFIVYLPDATTSTGRTISVKKSDSTANAVTVAAINIQTIDGAGSYIMATQYQSITVQSDGSNWIIL